MRDIFIFGSSSKAGSSSAIAREVPSQRRLLEEQLKLMRLPPAQTKEESKRQHEWVAGLIAEADEKDEKTKVLNTIKRLTVSFGETADARDGQELKLEMEKYLKILDTKMKQLKNKKEVQLQNKNKLRPKKTSKIKELEKQIGDTEAQLKVLREQRDHFEQNTKELEQLLQSIRMKKA